MRNLTMSSSIIRVAYFDMEDVDPTAQVQMSAGASALIICVCLNHLDAIQVYRVLFGFKVI